MTLDQGTEFMAEFVKTAKDNYSIKLRTITKHNPQANSMVKRCHQAIRNIIQTFTEDFGELDEDKRWYVLDVPVFKHDSKCGILFRCPVNFYLCVFDHSFLTI